MRYAMVIDLDRCMGCHTCSVACKQANNLPNGTLWNRVSTMGGTQLDTASGTYPNNRMGFLPVNCQHCNNPACVAVCPVEATYKREDGIVMQDNDKCIGCQSCIEACPYNVRTFNAKAPEYALQTVVGDADAPVHKQESVEKCTFCVNRLSRGEKPACMVLCPARARLWGDIDDEDSEVSRYLKGKKYMKLREEEGTDPSIYYVL